MQLAGDVLGTAFSTPRQAAPAGVGRPFMQKDETHE